MAKQLRSHSIQALLKLRDEIGAILSRKAATIKQELAEVGADYAEVGRIAVYGKRKTLAGRKVAAKYRDPKSGETWSGRGAPARWITAYEKAGRKREEFLIGAAGTKKAKTAKKKKKR